MGQVIGGKDERFGETAVFLFMGIGISGDLFDDLSVAVRGSNLYLDLLRGKLPLIFEMVEGLRSGVSVDEAYLLALFEKGPFMRTLDLIFTAS